MRSISQQWRADRILRHQQACSKYMGQHMLLSEDYWDSGRGARWLIGTEGDSHYRAEVFAGIFGTLLVHGDIDTVSFGHYGDKKDAFSRLCWMGCCEDVGYYVAQKARIGMGVWCREYDDQAALIDLQEVASEAAEDGAAELVEFLKEAEEYVEDEHTLMHHLWSSELWSKHELWEYRFGEVVPGRVLTAHSVLQKTVELLVERHGKQGPPQCR